MIRLSLFAAQAHRDDRTLDLTPRELELLALLAMERRAVSRERLEASLWPDSPAPRSALGVCVHRVRASLGAEVIVHRSGGYALGDCVSVDLWDFERLALDVRFVGPLGSELAARLLSAHAHLGARSGAERLRAGDVAAALDRRASALQRAFSERLAVDAMRGGRLDTALALAEQMIGADACDEDAWEIAIRAHLARRDRGAAIRSFRTYERELRAQLGLVPSAHVQRLLAECALAS